MRPSSIAAKSFALISVVCCAAFLGCEKSDSSTPPGEADAAPPDTEAEVGTETDLGDDAGGAGAEEATAAAVLTTGTFEETVNDHMQEVIDCYLAANGKNSKLEGTLNATFSFDGEGKVTGVVAADGSTLSDDGLTACIAEKAGAWAFPAPASGEGMDLSFPFQLAPG